ncbi:Lar family restriction alleviation protein [Enterobacter cloacae]|uniref:Lar family restriction alleviation protein n=1 Tax=Enterobacter cloacae TaxID=550 RepID=UPI00207552EC|nr:Lar family restriction alleviation protein [Enterobacter cloacae]MCM7405005.1 Lar family restriction alleviation protein [Enterobacter cloacae]
MSIITKEQLIEDLKASTQNSRGMFEIGEETICALMSLLTSPPAPVSVPDENGLLPCPCCGGRAEFDYDDDNLNWISCNVCGISTDTAYHTDVDARDRLRDVWNLRAAMLQGAEPVTTAYKLPANTPCKDAPEHIWLQTAGVWPENGEFSELTWCSDNQHTDDTLYVRADVVADNSPVVPDGYALVPVEPTAEMQSAAAGVIRFDTTPINKLWTGNAVYRAMIAEAPQQEV